MSSFFNAIKNLLTAYHIDKSSTGKIIEPIFEKGFFIMTKKVVDVKSVVLAGAALGAGVTLAAVQQPNTVSAATISSEDQQRNLAQSQK